MKKIITGILVFVLIAGGSAFFILISKYYESKKSKNACFISVKEMKTDYDYFFGFIKTEYPFREVCKRSGVDFEYIYNKNKQKLKKIINEVDYYNFYYEIIDELTSGKNFGHLSPVGLEACFGGNSPDMIFSNDNNKQKIKQFYSKFILQNKQAGLYDKQSYRIIQTKFDIATFKYIKPKIYENKKIAYLKLDDFGGADLFDKYNLENIIEFYNKEFMDFFNKTKNYNDVIIDLRDCHGGLIDTAELLTSILAANLDNTIYYRLLYSSKYTYLKEFYNKNISRIMGYKYSKSLNDIPPFNETNKNDKLLFDRMLIIKRKISPQKHIFNYSFRLWVLISNHTASSADTFTARIKKMGIGKIIGQPTKGDGLTVGYGYLLLPKSGLLIRSNLFYGLNPNGSCNAETGTAPDIYNSTDKDALETCLEEIKKIEDKNH